MKAKRTFLLLANEHEARFFENDGPGHGLTELGGMKHGEPVRYADIPGRSQGSGGMARHGFDRAASEREQGRAAFAVEVLEAVKQFWDDGRFDQFIMSASPKMLGELRSDLSADMRKVLLGDKDKDLLKLAPLDLPAHFDDMIVF
ncbi:host attachment protein [Actibacterium lipolyticum]|uniref:Protein required for attachment to host cells n=1 Tax=Actibacterium lipolyticum TaxID=1524263 RepID=A0A238JUR3_9RHOB|nr:host attachment protein [Actibacterium lipolyticum]SMX33562.1 Protein required for attachment to host cells [Actibacterium lipolyticum]